MSTNIFKKLLATFRKHPGSQLVFFLLLYTYSTICLFLFPWSILKLSENSKIFSVCSTGGLVDNHNYLSIHNYQIIQFSENSVYSFSPQLFKNFSKTLVYVYRYAYKSFSKVSFSKVFQSQGCTCTRIPKRLF